MPLSCKISFHISKQQHFSCFVCRTTIGNAFPFICSNELVTCIFYLVCTPLSWLVLDAKGLGKKSLDFYAQLHLNMLSKLHGSY